MIPESEKRELLDLLGAICNKTGSRDQLFRLFALLEQEPEHQQVYDRYFEIHQFLSAWANAEHQNQNIDGVEYGRT